MRCRLLRVEPARLVDALIAPEQLQRYAEAMQHEQSGVAERPMLRFLKQMQAIAARLAAEGRERIEETDPAALDALLTDVLALATWHGWPLPGKDLGERECDLAGARRGLLGADDSEGGARAYVLEDDLVAVVRSREAGDAADLREHGFGTM